MIVIVIFDLDGTLALIEHRRHFVEGDKKDFPAFNAACVDDAPNKPIVELFRMLEEKRHTMWMLSGRSEEVEQETSTWLLNNGIFYDALVMRRKGDYQPDDKLKLSWFKEHFSNLADEILCVFDDRQKVVDMWRENGLTCLQVAPGKF